ncbi:MAG: helix-turn-helix transcriptional regulator [Chthonomonadales bacterium]|nr:helix-turn-helix transcriptional regulator [Chthonomonadales bacterium]
MPRAPQEPVYMISVAAQLTGLHPQTVRLYERLGLITPRRVSNKNRLYSDEDIARLQQIRRFTRDMGVNLAGVEVILDLLRRIEEMQAEIDRLQAEVNRRSRTTT